MPVAQNPDREAAPDRTNEACPDCERLTLALEDAIEGLVSISLEIEMEDDGRRIAPMNTFAAHAVDAYIQAAREGRNREVERRNNAILRGAR